MKPEMPQNIVRRGKTCEKRTPAKCQQRHSNRATFFTHTLRSVSTSQQGIGVAKRANTGPEVTALWLAPFGLVWTRRGLPTVVSNGQT